MAIHFSTKRLQISKANARIVAIIALSAFVTTFSLVASRALLSQRAYQERVITEKQNAADQLHENIRAIDNLKNSYAGFVSSSANIIGGDPGGGGDRGGDNAKIILDALPSKYDFPALYSSIEKLLVERNFEVSSFTGTDDELTQAAEAESTDSSPKEIPFEVTINSDYNSLSTLLPVLERSIRPIHVTSLVFSGEDAATQLVISAKTYYQPAKSLDITTREVR